MHMSPPRHSAADAHSWKAVAGHFAAHAALKLPGGPALATEPQQTSEFEHWAALVQPICTPASHESVHDPIGGPKPTFPPSGPPAPA